MSDTNYIKDALLDSGYHRKLKEESKGLVNKWDKTGLLEGLDGSYEKSGMAILLENQAKQLLDEVNATSTTANSEEWSGVALPLVRRIFAEISAQDFVSVQPMNLPSGLVFYMDFKYGSNRAGDVNTESIYGTTGPKSPFQGQGQTENSSPFPEGGFYGAGQYGYTHASASTPAHGTGAAAATLAQLDYDSDYSASNAGNLTAVTFVGLATASNADLSSVKAWTFYSSSTAGTDDGLYTKLGTGGVIPQFTKVSGNDVTVVIKDTAQDLVDTPADTIKTTVWFLQTPQSHDRGDFEDKTGGGIKGTDIDIPEVSLDLKSDTIVAKTRKLKAVWTPELAQDLNAYHSIDAEAELTAMLSEYISMEIDLEILDMISKDAVTVDYWSAKVGFQWDGTSAFTDNSGQASLAYTINEWWQTLGNKIQKMSNKIHQLTLRGGANFLVCSPQVATILESIPGYNVTTDGTQSQFAMGVQKIGNLQNRWTVYKNPYMTSNEILVGFRGNNFLETGAVYAPYVPLIMTPLVYDPDNFTPRKGVMTRYAKKMVRPEFYGKIYVHGIETV
tara:strand:+ start:55 stop:1731 length:1677 start_codon:yes stop_codon:yes gene_type:complete